LSRRVRRAPGKTKWILLTFLIVTLLVSASYFSLQLAFAPAPASKLTLASTLDQVINLQEDSALFIYPESDMNLTKPSGASYASEVDFALCVMAGDILLGMAKNTQLSTTDSDSSYVDQRNGNPKFDGTTVIIGDSSINAATRYYEDTAQSPVLLGEDEKSLYVQNLTGGTLESTRINKKALASSNSTLDVFVVETFTDIQGRTVLILWGYTGVGAVSGALLLKFEISAQPEKHTSTYYVGRWTDAREGSSANGIPDEGDVYEIVSSGPPIAGRAYTVGWMEVSALYLVAFILVILAYSGRKGWIRVETQSDQ